MNLPLMIGFMHWLTGICLLVLICCNINKKSIEHIDSKVIPPFAILLAILGSAALVLHAMDAWDALSSKSPFEYQRFLYKTTGPNAWGFYLTILGPAILPMLLFVSYIRNKIIPLSFIVLLVNLYWLWEYYITYLVRTVLE